MTHDHDWATAQKPVNEMCSTCPYSRRTSKAYLDTRGDNGEAFLAQAHMPAVLPCHQENDGIATAGKCRQCAGAAMFRANVGVANLPEALGRLEADSERVFASNAELLAHHKGWTIADAAAYLVDNPLPELIVKQWNAAMMSGRYKLAEKTQNE